MINKHQRTHDKETEVDGGLQEAARRRHEGVLRHEHRLLRGGQVVLALAHQVFHTRRTLVPGAQLSQNLE